MTFSAVDEDSFVAQASEQHIVCNTDPGKVPAISSVPPGDTLVNKPMMHSAQKIDLDGIPGGGGGGPGTVSVFGSGRISGQ